MVIDENINELVTIGIPVYNMEESVVKAIQSCVVQTYQHIEILVVDDGSTDNSVSVIKQHITDSRIRIYQREQNGGVCAAMRDLVEQAKGKYICFLDADDTMMPSRVEKQYRAIKYSKCRYPSKRVASFCGSLVNDITTGTQYRIDPNNLWDATAEHSFGGGTGHSMYKVEDLKDLGNFDSHFSRSADSAMCLTFLMNGGFYAMLSEPLITYNFHLDQNKIKTNNSELKIFVELRKEIAAENPRNLYLQRFIRSIPFKKKLQFRLFGIIPLLTLKYKQNKIWLRLFGLIPFISIRFMNKIQPKETSKND